MIRFLTEFIKSEIIKISIKRFDINDFIYDCFNANNNSSNIQDCNYSDNYEEIDCGGAYDYLLNVNTNNMYKIEKNEHYEKIISHYLKYLLNTDIINFLTIPETLCAYNNIYLHTTNVDILNNNKIKNSELKTYTTAPIENIKSDTRLEIPNFSIKLSDNINGITLNQDFSITLYNDDGLFDNEYEWNLYNTPLTLKKSIKENPDYNDFILIRDGFISALNTNFNTINISISDKIRSMENSINKVIKQEDFIIILDEKIIDKPIPIVYGKNKIKLLQLNDGNYYATDYITTLHGIYDKDNNPVNYTYNANTKIINTTGKPDYAIITGYTNNRIGEIIKSLIIKYTDFEYNNSNFDIREFDIYVNESDSVNIIFTNHTVKKAIQDVLKSDMAYFIQKLDGRFTIRRYRDIYKTHIINSWAITKTPEKNWNKSIENYFSSCVVNYNIQDKEYGSYLNDKREKELIEFYNKEIRKSFDTNLDDINNARYLSNLLYDRYGNLKHTLKLNVGIDTSKMELLDFVNLNSNINNRKFSESSYYIIKELNPAQDSLVLEEIDYLDLTGEYPDTNTNYYEHDYDNLYAYTHETEYEYMVEGGWL
jgi:hypothetical protein